MTDTPLKSVVVLDPESQAYLPSAHNLDPSAAASLAEESSNANRTAKVLDQEGRHRTSDPTKCRACQRAAEKASQPPYATEPSEAVAS